ncbi:hypothetical protein ACQVA2_22220 (plasmid) [Citrobacter sp. OP27]
MAKKYKVFTSLSRRKRRTKTQRVKNLIFRERHRCGGVFYDECDLQYASNNGNWTWSDIIFLGSKPETYWNAEIITPGIAFDDAVESLAFDRAKPVPSGAFLNEDGQFTAAWRLPQPQYDGLTWLQHVANLKQEIARDISPKIYCGYRIRPGYRSGIGLQIIADTPSLSREIIEAAIADFRAKGELNWLSPEPAKVAFK